MKKSNFTSPTGDPYEQASFWSRITFSWVNPVVDITRYRSFMTQDHHDLSAKFDASRTIANFEKDFERHRSLNWLFLHNISGKCVLIMINLVFTLCEVANVYLLYGLTEYLKEIKDGHQNLDKQQLATYFGLMILSNILLNLMETMYDFLLYREFMKIKNNYTLMIIKYILKINMHSNSETSRGNLVNLIQIDCAAVEDVGYELVLSTYIFFQFVICFGIGFALFGGIFVFYIGGSCFFMLIAVILENICMKIDKQFMNIRDDRISFVSSVLSNIRFVKFNVLENYFAKITAEYRRKEVRLLCWYNIFYAFTVFIDWIASAAAKVAFLIFYFLKYSKMALQQYMAFINLDFMLSSGFSHLPWVFAAMFRIRLSFQRIDKFFAIPPFYSNIIHEHQSVEPIDSTQGDSGVRETKQTINGSQSGEERYLKEEKDAGLNGMSMEEPISTENEEPAVPSIEMNNVNFSYFNPEVEEFEHMMEEDDDSSSDEEVEPEEEYDNDLEESGKKEPLIDEEAENPLETETNEPAYKMSKNHLALRDIKLSIKKGELVFIMGAIGSGKSSFLYSLIGELNQIVRDNIVNRSSTGEEFIKIRGDVTFSPQKPFILTKTVSENILFFEPENKERLEKAIKMASLDDDIASFDNGVNKLLIENGMNLSGGQRSRINLARCFYRDSDIYLLDSPFSALDFDTSKKILEESIVKGLAGKTRIIVTHNIQFLKYADRIILLKRGKVSFSGNFSEFTQTAFYKNYRTSVKFNQSNGNYHLKPEIVMRKRSMSKTYIDHVDRKISMSKVSHQILAITQEEREYFKGFLNEDRVEGRQLKKMFSLIFKYYGGIMLLLVLFIACIAANYMYYIASLYLYDLIDEGKTTGDSFWKDIQYYIWLNVWPAVISFFRVIILSSFSIRTSRRLHQRMLFEVLHADLCLFHDKVEPARIINRFSSDHDSVDFYIWSYVNEAILLFSFLSFEIFITKEATSVYMIGIFAFYYIAIFYYQSLYIKARKDLFRLERIGNTPIINLTNQIIEGSVVIKVFKKQKEIIDELADLINQNSKNTVTIASLNGWFNTRLAFINIFCIQLLAFAYILVFTTKSTINAKQLEIFISLIYTMILDSKGFMQKFCSVETEAINLERCDALLNLPSERRYMNLARERKAMANVDSMEASSLLPLKIYGADENQVYSYSEINDFGFNKTFFLRGKIVFENVFAKYPLTTDYVLRNITFDLKPGEKLGIIGKTGSGKSTILKLLLQYFTPEKGSIVVDGYDITKIDAKKLRSEFLVISQEVTLFEGSLRDNLLFENVIHKKEHDKTHRPSSLPKDHTVNQPLTEPLITITEPNNENEAAEFEAEVISKLIEFGFSKSKLNKHGLNLPITNSGENLSTGEQQLIAFFKSFFTKKKIIFLDEATAPFDYVTQQRLIEYFNGKIKGKTVISVAHKIAAIADFDKVLVLDNGFVVEYGYIKEIITHEGSHFKSLVEQYFGF